MLKKILLSPSWFLVKKKIQLIEVCNREETTPGELAEVILKDPAISAKVMQLVNSAFIGLVNKPGSLEQADGPGLPAEVQARIFEPFNSAKGGGHAGLGLSIVHSIVKSLDGRITCESREGRGTRFAVRLPLA
ncbi:MAG: ATP-binding protein [Desulfobacterales bacterium]|nr:ATP-binding protein [Desulfobacterales bacterium]